MRELIDLLEEHSSLPVLCVEEAAIKAALGDDGQLDLNKAYFITGFHLQKNEEGQAMHVFLGLKGVMIDAAERQAKVDAVFAEAQALEEESDGGS